MSCATVRLSTATSATDDPEMPAKNMLNSVTTCAGPPRRCPTSVCESRIIRVATSEAAISSPTSRKNGTASSVSASIPWNSWPIIDCNAGTRGGHRDRCSRSFVPRAGRSRPRPCACRWRDAPVLEVWWARSIAPTVAAPWAAVLARRAPRPAAPQQNERGLSGGSGTASPRSAAT